MGLLKLFSGTLAVSALIAGSAAAQNFPGGPGLITLRGTCQKLVAGKVDASKGCKGELASVTAPNGTVTFIFTSQGKMLGFGGDGGTVHKSGSDDASLTLNLVSTGVGTKMTGEVPVTGTCTFGNPYTDKQIMVQCTAKSKDYSFAGTFKTAGKATPAAAAKAPAKKK